MKKLPIGKDDFKKLIETDCYYVDQTKLIEELRDNECEVVLFPRPRRFGKSLAISMLENFFEIRKKDTNKNLFKGLYIEKSKYYSELSSYPVINLTFKELKEDNLESFYNAYKELMVKLFEQKKYIYDSLLDSQKLYYDLIVNRKANNEQYKFALGNLSTYLKNYHNKPTIILIDEYDVPIQNAYLESKAFEETSSYYKNVVNFIKGAFSNALKTNENLAFAVLTGVLRVSKESIFSDLNNVKVYGLYNSNFGEYFGFKKDDTKKLLEYYGLELTKEVKEMYDGYLFNSVNIYNPWSVLNYASDKVLGTYWINTSGNDLVKKALFKTNSKNKKVIEDLIEGNSFQFTYNEKLTYLDFDKCESREIILNLLFASGYLTIDNSKERDVEKAYLKIPNKEVKKLISNIMAESILDNYTYFTNDIEKCINTNDMAGLEEILNEILSYTSFMDTKESFYHGYILGLFSEYLTNNKYKVRSNRESGMGRYDVMIEKIDKTFGYIFEFKVADDNDDMERVAKLALEQIKTKEYYQELLSDGVKDIHLISIVFKDKKAIVR